MLRIAFLGTPAFAVPFLRALAADGAFSVTAAISQPDKPSGRGNEVKPPAIKLAAQELGIPVLQPVSLKKDPGIVDQLRALNADVFVVVAYGKLIPKELLRIPRLGCVNVHPSLLPRHRGPAPMQAAIAEQDAETGVSIMTLDEGMDTGPLLAQASFPIDNKITYAGLETKVHELGAPLLVDVLKGYAAGKVVPSAQEGEATVTRLLEREDGKADWTRSAAALDAKRRAYGSWPGLWTEWNGTRIKLLETEPVADTLAPGRVRFLNDALEIGTGNGVLRVAKLQPEDGKPMSAEAFHNGHPELDGTTIA